ncbi:MAG: MATE family efflux transporter [Chloroflexi bacterium]|nr:MATE family efflux transporter [Chloroflexota bacterium]
MKQNFFQDREFWSALWRLWLPMALLQLVFSLLNLVSVMMVGQLGETAVAAVGLANQIMFLCQLLLFGVGSGAAIFVAQFWGKHDIKNIRRVLGICLGLGLLGAAIFSFIALVIPDLALGVYTRDPAVIALGGEYLRISGLSYFAIAISTSYAITLRSTGNVRLPVTMSILALIFGALLSFALIFGEWGFPALGVRGSAIGATIARLIECTLLLFVAYSTRSAAAASLRELTRFNVAFLASVLKNVIPVTLNEILWSLGISVYSLIYARIGTASVAAVSIAATIEMLAYVPFIGLANSAAVLIGNRIGADEERQAFDYARRFMLLVIAVSVFVGSAIFLSADPVLGFYKIDATTRHLARNVLTIMAFALIKASNMMLIVGILRAGGDTRASALIDVSPLWLVGLPAAALGAFVFDLPVYWVFALTISDEACKVILASWRVISKKWIRNLARQHGEVAL